MMKGNGCVLGEVGGVIGRWMKAGKGFGFLETKEGSFLKISEGIGGGLGVGIGLRLRLLSGMLETPSNTLFCSLFSLELEEMQRRRKECTGGEEVGNSGLGIALSLSGSLLHCHTCSLWFRSLTLVPSGPLD